MANGTFKFFLFLFSTILIILIQAYRNVDSINEHIKLLKANNNLKGP